MGIQEIMMKVWAIGGVMTRRGNTLVVETTGRVVPPSLRKAIRANKAALLTVAMEREQVKSSSKKKRQLPQQSRHQSRHSD